MTFNKKAIIKLLISSIFIIFLLIKNNDINENWIKYKFNPILGNNSTGTVFDPFIIKHEGLYKIYVSWRPKGTIALSSSQDGIKWTDLKTVLDKGNTTSWEKIVNRASILQIKKKFYMWYTGQNNGKSQIGFAFSNNGYNFLKYKNNPVLKPEYEYEKKSVMNPHVLYDKEEKLFKMWYSAGEMVEPDVICYAISKDGINWIKYNKNPIFIPNLNKKTLDFYKIGGCDVHKISSQKYLMFYIGYSDINTARIFIAISQNGINNWKRKSNPIIKPTKGQFDNNACYKPSAFFDKKNNKWMIWYNGRNKNKEFIGLAFHKNYKFSNFINIFKNLIPY